MCFLFSVWISRSDVLLGTDTRKSKLYQIHSSKWIQLYQMTRYYLEKVSPQNCLGKQETRERRHRKATEFIENRVKVHQHAWEDATKKKKKDSKRFMWRHVWIPPHPPPVVQFFFFACWCCGANLTLSTS